MPARVRPGEGIFIRVTREEKEAWRAEADRRGLSVAKLVSYAMRAFLRSAPSAEVPPPREGGGD